ncbi:MAG: 50S ribosomal protein L11 methyltransferase [Anaerolineales bacterium]
MKWLEVSLTVPGELAEPVADVFARHAPGGVAMFPQIGDDASSAPSALVTVCAYLAMDGEIDVKRTRIAEGLWHLSQIDSLPQLSVRPIKEQDWKEVWKERFHPIPVGQRLLVQPAWFPPPSGPRLPILIDPGMAFGVGSHPTTRLCLEALEEHILPGSVVVDLGCGSGILSIAAARLGAASVLGLDVDPEAVQAARSNVERNQVGDRVEVRQGSLSELKDWVTGTRSRPSLLMANILARVLEQLIGEGIGEVVEEGGKLVISGILESQLPSLLGIIQDKGLELLAKHTAGDWIALILQRKTPPVPGGDPYV